MAVTHRLGEKVSPLEVVDGGPRGLHGVTSGVSFIVESGAEGGNGNGKKSMLVAETYEAGLVAWGPPDPFPSPIHEDPDMSLGASFMLFNNIWNTNYVNWYPFEEGDENLLFRFRLTFS